MFTGLPLGDMDKNGTTDIIVAEQDQAPLRRVTVYYNDGNGVLKPETIMALAPSAVK